MHIQIDIIWIFKANKGRKISKSVTWKGMDRDNLNKLKTEHIDKGFQLELCHSAHPPKGKFSYSYVPMFLCLK